jgi:hypothetical protein
MERWWWTVFWGKPGVLIWFSNSPGTCKRHRRKLLFRCLSFSWQKWNKIERRENGAVFFPHQNSPALIDDLLFKVLTHRWLTWRRTWASLFRPRALAVSPAMQVYAGFRRFFQKQRNKCSEIPPWKHCFSIATQIRNNDRSMRRLWQVVTLCAADPTTFTCPPVAWPNLAANFRRLSPRFSGLTLEDGLQASSMKTLAGLPEWNLMETLQRWTLQIPQAQRGTGCGWHRQRWITWLTWKDRNFPIQRQLRFDFSHWNCFSCQSSSWV